jgi:hypothetical protein
VVSTPVPEVVQLKLCKIASGKQAFVEAVRQAIAEGAGPTIARSQSIAHESWDAKVDEIRGHVHGARQAMKGK